MHAHAHGAQPAERAVVSTPLLEQRACVLACTLERERPAPLPTAGELPRPRMDGRGRKARRGAARRKGAVGPSRLENHRSAARKLAEEAAHLHARARHGAARPFQAVERRAVEGRSSPARLRIYPWHSEPQAAAQAAAQAAVPLGGNAWPWNPWHSDGTRKACGAALGWNGFHSERLERAEVQHASIRTRSACNPARGAACMHPSARAPHAIAPAMQARTLSGSSARSSRRAAVIVSATACPE